MDTAQNIENLTPLPITPDMVMGKLKELGISFTYHSHPPIFTVAEGEELKLDIPGTHTRNLFVRDKKERMFLITLANETQVDIKKLSDVLGCGRLSFGSAERLWDNLGIRPGSVNPFTVWHDTENKVELILDATMMKGEIVNYHPNDNAATVGLIPADLIKFLDAIGHNHTIMDLSAAAPDT